MQVFSSNLESFLPWIISFPLLLLGFLVFVCLFGTSMRWMLEFLELLTFFIASLCTECWVGHALWNVLPWPIVEMAVQSSFFLSKTTVCKLVCPWICLFLPSFWNFEFIFPGTALCFPSFRDSSKLSCTKDISLGFWFLFFQSLQKLVKLDQKLFSFKECSV